MWDDEVTKLNKAQSKKSAGLTAGFATYKGTLSPIYNHPDNNQQPTRYRGKLGLSASLPNQRIKHVQHSTVASASAVTHTL